jgi:hypothetical protein
MITFNKMITRGIDKVLKKKIIIAPCTWNEKYKYHKSYFYLIEVELCNPLEANILHVVKKCF